jgi:hypothetical protein
MLTWEDKSGHKISKKNQNRDLPKAGGFFVENPELSRGIENPELS